MCVCVCIGVFVRTYVYPWRSSDGLALSTSANVGYKPLWQPHQSENAPESSTILGSISQNQDIFDSDIYTHINIYIYMFTHVSSLRCLYGNGRLLFIPWDASIQTQTWRLTWLDPWLSHSPRRHPEGSMAGHPWSPHGRVRRIVEIEVEVAVQLDLAQSWVLSDHRWFNHCWGVHVLGRHRHQPPMRIYIYICVLE